MRATEVNKGSARGDNKLNGQWGQHKYYCSVCHKETKLFQSHAVQGCHGKIVEISTTAKLPRKNASKKQWELFNKKFVKEQD